MTAPGGETWVEFEALELEGTAHWRTEKSQEYPDDNRNAEAVETCEMLSSQLRQLEGKPKAAEFNALLDFVSECGSDVVTKVHCQMNEYRSRIGFDSSPASAEEYIDDLMDIAREASQCDEDPNRLIH